MAPRTTRLTLLIDPNKKAAFECPCVQQDPSPYHGAFTSSPGREGCGARTRKA